MSPEKLLKLTEKFLDRERRHTHETTKTLYIYRERSIDDGSRFDPRIDKYEPINSLQRRRERITQTDSLDKSEKRFNSLGRVSFDFYISNLGVEGGGETLKSQIADKK